MISLGRLNVYILIVHAWDAITLMNKTHPQNLVHICLGFHVNKSSMESTSSCYGNLTQKYYKMFYVGPEREVNGENILWLLIQALAIFFSFQCNFCHPVPQSHFCWISRAHASWLSEQTFKMCLLSPIIEKHIKLSKEVADHDDAPIKVKQNKLFPWKLQLIYQVTLATLIDIW